MSRLLFAAARGARTQYMVGYPNRWETFKNVLPRKDQDYTRIHPDDEHLQYGPISTALRGMADIEDSPRGDMLYDTLAGVTPYSIEPRWILRTASIHRSLFLLILAEALADEGL